MSGAAAIAALPPPTAPPAGPVGAREPEASPLTVSTCSNACLGQEVQRKARLMRTFCSGGAIRRVVRAVGGQSDSTLPSWRSLKALRPQRRERAPAIHPQLADGPAVAPPNPAEELRHAVDLSLYRPLGKASSSRLNSGSQSASPGIRSMPRSILSVWTANRVFLSSRGM